MLGMLRKIVLLAILISPAGAFAQCVGPLQAGNNLSDLCNASTARTNLGVAYGTSSSTVTVGNDSRFTTNAATGFAMPFSTIPTTADVDIYGLGFAASIAASTVPTALCRVSPAATVTFLVKKWTAGNPATSSTLCTGSLSTACAVSSCSISSTSFAAADGISIEATAASADSAARVTITVPMTR
jgi:hypothetical protein